MKYQLHKIPEGFIITSDEEPLEKDFVYAIDTYQGTSTTLGKLLSAEFGGYKVEPISKIPTYCRFGKDEVFKVIAQQDKIDFSVLSEEEQKEIGWFDVERLSQENYPISNINWTNKTKKDAFIVGFQKAQELLSDRRFTEQNIIDSLYKGEELAKLFGTNKMEERNIFIQSLSQPKHWEVEIEMVHSSYTTNGKGEDPKTITEFYPKFTNNKVKILKIYE